MIPGPIYNVNSTSNYTLAEASNPSFDLINQTLAQYSMPLMSKSTYTLTLLSLNTIEILENQSYVLSNFDSMAHYITVKKGQNYTENITLPCSTDTPTTLTYSTYDNGVDPVPSWVTPDFTQFILDIRVPEDIQESNYTYMIETTIPDGSVINYYYISFG